MNKVLSLSFLMLLCSCSSEKFERVDISEYRKMGKCWEKNETIHSFISINIKYKKHYPFFISPICSISSEFENDTPYILDQMNSIEMDSDNGILKSLSLYNERLEENYATDVAWPEGNDKVYVFVGRFGSKIVEGRPYYYIKEAKMFKNTNYDVKSIAKMRPELRRALFENICECKLR